MQQTMDDLVQYWKSLELPVRHFMYDSWWYWKECGGGPGPNTWLSCRGAVELWEPRPDVFPDTFNFRVGYPLALHNRYFSARNNTYVKQLGFQNSFILEENVDFALPINADVFKYLMGKAKAWGMVLYEQDWLVTVWRGMNVTRSNVDAASTWLTAMADAADSLQLTIQYCMALPRHMLESTHFQAVTNSRASGDYAAGQGNYDISMSSLFYWAIGVAPSKDDYWTSENQPNPPYSYNASEPNWQLQAITIALSTGPNGPSDAIGYTNKSLVMSTIRGDGLNLQPDRPATTMDTAFITGIFKTGTGVEDLRSTWCAHANHSYRTHSILAVSLGSDFTLSYDDFKPHLAASSYYIYDWFSPLALPSNLQAGGTFVIPQGQGQPSAPSRAHSIRYYITAPVLPGGWVLYGDASKIVTTSHQRIDHVRASPSGFSADVIGSSGEAAGVTLWVSPPGASGALTISVVCPSSAGNVAQLACISSTGKCTCA